MKKLIFIFLALMIPAMSFGAFPWGMDGVVEPLTLTQPLHLPDGTAALPSLAWEDAAGNWDGGFYLGADNLLGLTIAGSNKMYFGVGNFAKQTTGYLPIHRN